MQGHKQQSPALIDVEQLLQPDDDDRIDDLKNLRHRHVENEGLVDEVFTSKEETAASMVCGGSRIETEASLQRYFGSCHRSLLQVV